ncbi:MAG: FAD-dependent oxidoreductase [bacterium]
MSAQVCVVGGGAAGLAAATSAARQGVQTLLLEESYKVGGNLTRGLVNLDKVAWGGSIMVGGYFRDLLKTLEIEGQAVYPSEETAFSTQCDPDALERKALQFAGQAGVKVRLGAPVTGVEKDGALLRAVWAQGQGATLRVTAEVFIDATGDGHLGYLAGHPYWLGDRNHGDVQGQTLIFYAGPVDWDRLSDYVRREGGLVDAYRLVGLRPFMGRLQARGGVLAEVQAGMLINRNLWPEMVSISASETYQNQLEPNALVQIMEVLGEQNREIHHALTVEVPGFRDSRIIRVADRPYLREGRRLVGHYQLSVDDIGESRKPQDSVARGWYPLDLHVHDSPGGSQHAPFRAGEYYGIPYRCLVARDLDNLLMAGRCISVTHEALGSTRISPVSMSLGQAAGIAAALCARHNLKPSLAPIKDIQNEILAAGGLI